MHESDLGNRMKRYEAVSDDYLLRRVPVIVRIDGRAFHTFTRGMKRPFDDDILLESMRQTMKYLCENIGGCVFGYTQSDEITLVLTDYKTIHTEPWFGYRKSKVISICSSMATWKFNDTFRRLVEAGYNEYFEVWDRKDEDDKLWNTYNKAVEKGALFDCRAFNVPIDDVCNNTIWRQADASRNSVEQVGHFYFSDKELYKKSVNDIQDMLVLQKNVNWNDFPVHLKRGSSCIKIDTEKKVIVRGEEKVVPSCEWVVDKKMPILTQNRDYVESRIYIRED